MSKQQWIIANLQYKSPRRTGRGQGIKGLKNALKYFEYRDNGNNVLPREARQQRWVDHGLGEHYRAILDNSIRQRSEHVLAWLWVISPEPDVMILIPPEGRQAFMEELTEAVVDRYYEERGFEVEYSYVVHQAKTRDGRPHTHSHVILPGMAERHLGEREPMVNYNSRGHLTLLDEIAHQELWYLMERELGRDWAHRLPARLAIEPLQFQ